MEEKLSNAIISGDIQFLETYFNNGNDLKGITLVSPDGYGIKPIKLAILSQIRFKGSSQISKLVLKHSSEQVLAEVLVSFASEDKYLEEMKALLEIGVLVDLAHENQTPLQRATGNENLKMVHLLLSYGADPNKTGEYGSALEKANKIHYEPAFEKMMVSFMNGEPKSPFDFVDKDKIIRQLNSWIHCLKNFAKDNKNQTFYVLAIDGGQLKANSEEEFKATLKQYQDDFPGEYVHEEEINRLKFSVGDFSFYEIEKEIDAPLENDKTAIDLAFIKRQENDNRTEKDLLLEGLLKNKELFTREMNITNDFKIMADGHIY